MKRSDVKNAGLGVDLPDGGSRPISTFWGDLSVEAVAGDQSGGNACLKAAFGPEKISHMQDKKGDHFMKASRCCLG